MVGVSTHELVSEVDLFGRLAMARKVSPVRLDRLRSTHVRDIHEVQDAQRGFTAFSS